MMAKLFTILAVLCLLMLGIAYPVPAADTMSEPKSIGIEEILFAPSSFNTAFPDNLTVSAYLRTMTKEWDAPDKLGDRLDTADVVLALRLGRWGTTFGWSRAKDDKIMEPRILAIDYKHPLPYMKNNFAFAMDFKMSTMKLPDSNLRESILDFGVFSISGIASKEISELFEFYGGLTANYIYIDARMEKLTDKWKLVPFLGLRINVSPYYTTQIVTEISRGRANSSEDAMWNWHLGVSMGF